MGISKVVGVQKKTEKCKSKDEIIDLSINWQGDGDSVLVAGDFNNWQPEQMMQGENGIWTIKKKLQAGKCYLKFIVDGKWVINENLESVTDAEGNINNQINVQSHHKRQESSSVGLKQISQEHKENIATSEELDMKETDTIKRSNKAKSKDKKVSKCAEDRNESNDSTSSVTETENTVIIKDSEEKENIFNDQQFQSEVSIKEKDDKTNIKNLESKANIESSRKELVQNKDETKSSQGTHEVEQKSVDEDARKSNEDNGSSDKESKKENENLQPVNEITGSLTKEDNAQENSLKIKTQEI